MLCVIFEIRLLLQTTASETARPKPTACLSSLETLHMHHRTAIVPLIHVFLSVTAANCLLRLFRKQARIDRGAGVLYARHADARSATFAKVLQSSQDYIRETKV